MIYFENIDFFLCLLSSKELKNIKLNDFYIIITYNKAANI